MKNAVILHGRPSREEYYDQTMLSMSNAHWIPWLQGQLLKNDIDAATPEVPHAFHPKWETWVREVERFEMGPQTTLVGHSTGAGFFIKYLSINPSLKVGKVVLVAPWLDPDGELERGFFDNFEIDAGLVSRTGGVTVFNSDDDMESVHKTVSTLRQRIKNLTYIEFQKYGHFCFNDMKTQEFPELLKEVLA
jgi:predicted alpha/beta hydrolase family esterase